MIVLYTMHRKYVMNIKIRNVEFCLDFVLCCYRSVFVCVCKSKRFVAIFTLKNVVFEGSIIVVYIYIYVQTVITIITNFILYLAYVFITFFQNKTYSHFSTQTNQSIQLFSTEIFYMIFLRRENLYHSLKWGYTVF